MKVVVKKVDALKRLLNFEIPRERVKQKLEEVYRDLGKVAKVKGFRPGKVPRDVLEREHGQLAKEETIKKLIPEVYQEGVQQENLDPLDLPDIDNVDFKDGVITFTAQIDIKPEVKVKNYKGIQVQRKSSKVTDEEIDKTLDYFKKSQGKGEDVKIDDAFVKGLGVPTLEEFKASLLRQMEIDKDRQNRFDVENQIVEALLKDAKLLVPPTLVKKQLDHRLHEMRHRLKSQGMSEEDMTKKENEVRKDLQKAVERDVKVYLILDKIAQDEKIAVKEGENLAVKVMEFLLKEANWEYEK